MWLTGTWCRLRPQSRTDLVESPDFNNSDEKSAKFLAKIFSQQHGHSSFVEFYSNCARPKGNPLYILARWLLLSTNQKKNCCINAYSINYFIF